MKIKITKLVYWGIASFCMLSVMGQEKITAIRIAENNLFQEEVKLRADDETGRWWPDSVIYYNYLGEPTFKQYYDKEKQTSIYANLENGNWILDEPYSSKGFSFFDIKPTYQVLDDGRHFFYANHFFWGGGTPLSDLYIAETKYDSNGNLIYLDFSVDFSETFGLTYNITYNEKNNPVLLEYYSNNFLLHTTQYEYNENGHCTQIKVFEYNEDKKIMEMSKIETMKYDKEGRPIGGNCLFLKDGERSSSMLFYYPDGAYTPDVEVDNNNPVDNNQGGFDIDVNIPTDSINNGNITITLPEGFTLEEENTTLTLDFAGLFELKITKQENNSWLIEINPKSIKSAALTNAETAKMLYVAYKIDKTLVKGIYDISINNILFETKGGNLIPEPAITVPVNVNRWGVDNEHINSTKSTVYVNNNTLYIQTAQTEKIAVYSPTGIKLYDAKIPSGTTTIDATNFPKGVLFVKSSSGWSKKVVLQ